jgi:nucleoside-diphosphate-sugar epimerase
MRILVTGSKGFTGKHFIPLALMHGYEVFNLISDLRDHHGVAQEVKQYQPTHVVHLAAISAVTHENSMELFDVNVLGVLNLLDQLKLTKNLQKILLTSSANIYGNINPSPIKESAITSPQNLYSYSKFSMELLVKSYVPELPCFIVRPFNYTGIGHDERFVIPKIVKAFKQRQTFIELGNIEVEREFNDVRMVCDAYLKLLNHAQNGEIYNICTGNVISIRKIIQEMIRISGHNIQVNINPELIRKNEIFSLYGDNQKLIQAIGAIKNFSVIQTLETMYFEEENTN